VIVFCMRCWAENAEDSQLCVKCGAPLDADDGTYVEKLANSLMHPIPSTAMRAAWVLGRRREKSAVEPLIKAIESRGEEGIMSSAVEALGEIGDPRAIPTLTKLLEGSYLKVRLKAIEALEKIGSDDAQRQIVKALNDPNLVIRRAAEKALKNLGSIRGCHSD